PGCLGMAQSLWSISLTALLLTFCCKYVRVNSIRYFVISRSSMCIRSGTVALYILKSLNFQKKLNSVWTENSCAWFVSMASFIIFGVRKITSSLDNNILLRSSLFIKQLQQGHFEVDGRYIAVNAQLLPYLQE